MSLWFKFTKNYFFLSSFAANVYCLIIETVLNKHSLWNFTLANDCQRRNFQLLSVEKVETFNFRPFSLRHFIKLACRHHQNHPIFVITSWKMTEKRGTVNNRKDSKKNEWAKHQKNTFKRPQKRNNNKKHMKK